MKNVYFLSGKKAHSKLTIIEKSNLNLLWDKLELQGVHTTKQRRGRLK